MEAEIQHNQFVGFYTWVAWGTPEEPSTPETTKKLLCYFNVCSISAVWPDPDGDPKCSFVFAIGRFHKFFHSQKDVLEAIRKAAATFVVNEDE